MKGQFKASRECKKGGIVTFSNSEIWVVSTNRYRAAKRIANILNRDARLDIVPKETKIMEVAPQDLPF